MLTIYKTDVNNKIKILKEFSNNVWIDLVDPTMEEIEKVVAMTEISRSLILKMLDDEELPRIEIDGNSKLIVVDVPYMTDKTIKNKYVTIPIGIITNDKFLITISLKQTDVLNDFKDNRIKDLYTSKKTRFIIQLLFRVATLYIKYLNLIDQEIERKEKFLIKSTSNSELLNLMQLQKSLVYFTTSLKANDVILDKLAKGNIINLYDDDLDLLEDAMIESKQGIEMAAVYREIISSMSDNYANIISNNLNQVMKFLAGITIVFSIPTMIASFMGMNVPLGFLADNPYAFIIVLIISILLALIIAWILKKKDML